MLRAAAFWFAAPTVVQPAAASFVPQVATKAATLLSRFASDLLLLAMPTVAWQLDLRRFS